MDKLQKKLTQLEKEIREEPHNWAMSQDGHSITALWGLAREAILLAKGMHQDLGDLELESTKLKHRLELERQAHADMYGFFPHDEESITHRIEEIRKMILDGGECSAKWRELFLKEV